MRPPSTYLVDLCLAHTVFRRTPRRNGSTRTPSRELWRSLANFVEVWRLSSTAFSMTSLVPPVQNEYLLFFLRELICRVLRDNPAMHYGSVFLGGGGGISFFLVIEVGQATKSKTPVKPQLACPINNSGEIPNQHGTSF